MNRLQFPSSFASHRPYVLCFLLALCSCGHTDNVQTRIPLDIETSIDPAEIEYQPTVSEVVALETIPESLFGSIDRIEYYHERFYILDLFISKSVLMFSRQGKFLGKTILGKGPGEIVNPFAFCIDREENNILIWDQTLRTLFTYDLDLKIKSQQQLQMFISDIRKIDGKYLLHSQTAKPNGYSFLLYSGDFQKIDFTFDSPIQFSGGMYFQRSMSIGDDHELLIAPNNYSIYELKNELVSSKYVLDFGNKMIDENMQKEDVGTIWKSIWNGTFVSFPVDVFESPSFVGFQVNYRDSPYTYFISKTDNNTFRINDFFSDDLPKCQIRGSMSTESKDLFYATATPETLLKHKEKGWKALNNIPVSSNANPFLFFIEVTPK